MKKHLFLLLTVLTLLLFHCSSPAHAQTSPAGNKDSSANAAAELRTVVPEGVKEIDLRDVLGDGAAEVYYAWMCSADTCVLLRQPDGPGDHELIVFNMRDNTVLSRTTVPYAAHQHEQGFEDGVFYLLYVPKGEDMWAESFSYTKATVAPDGTVDISTVPGGRISMPGGKTAVREKADRSLYAVDLKTGKEELLIQGVAPMTNDSQGASYETFLKYVPCPDDAGYDEVTFPVDEDTYYENDIFLWRDFYVYKPLDEYRFIYKVYGWEWGAGYGIYDLKTHTDHRITGRGNLCGVMGNTLYGSALKTDVDTLESTPLPASVQEQLEYANDMGGVYAEYDISPNGRLLALSDTDYPYNDASTITVTDMETGGIIKEFDIINPFALESSVSFYIDTRVMLFFYPKEHGSAYMYLFDTAE